jgi:predicted PurR-regulated permease PerM
MRRIAFSLVIVAILIGWQLIGFWGFVFAVPIAAVVYSIGFVILGRAVRRIEEMRPVQEPPPPEDEPRG